MSFRYVVGVTGLVLWCSCSPEPVALKYGTDVCHFCKMTLVDQKFGAELVTNTGKVYAFDDINCFINYYNSGYDDPGTFVYRLVVDYSNPGKFISATEAFYLKSPEIRSPMDGQVAAFETKAGMDNFNKQWKGIYLAWGEVVTQFK